MASVTGRLQVVATPIGNLADLSDRAREALAAADVIAAEDTRHTAALLKAHGIAKPLLSLHEHNESRRVGVLLARLAAGERVVLVSDAGTPLLSDPGYELVRRAAAAGFEVSPVPGPSAITAALAIAGLPTDRFCFEGFLPARERERRAVLGPEREAVVARELTKAHETVYRGTVGELARRAATEANFARGEITLVVHGAVADAAGVDQQLLLRTIEVLSKELPPGRVAAVAAQLTGASRAAAYALATRGAAGPDAADI